MPAVIETRYRASSASFIQWADKHKSTTADISDRSLNVRYRAQLAYPMGRRERQSDLYAT